MSMNKQKIIVFPLILCFLIVAIAFYIFTDATASEKTKIDWNNIHLVIEENQLIDGEQIEFTWDYWRDDRGFWRKELNDIKGVDKPEEHIGYFMVFNGNETLEFIPKVNTLLVTKHNKGDVFEAGYALAPQRLMILQQEIKNKNINLETSSDIILLLIIYNVYILTTHVVPKLLMFVTTSRYNNWKGDIKLPPSYLFGIPKVS